MQAIDADSAETLPVSITVLGIERSHSGSVAALADVEVDIGGVVIVLQGVQVVRAAGGLAARSPQFRDSAGRWASAVLLPETLQFALGKEVLDAYYVGSGAH